MENMTGKVERMVRKNAKKRFWRRAVAIPAAIVVFITTYALILPAIAMERDTYCGLEAHQHTEECYTAQPACGYEEGQILQSTKTVTELACTAAPHQHTEACFDENGAVICGYADYLVHEHTADCYNEQGELVCPLPEVKAHTHDDSCYVTETVNVCGQSESEGHVHDAGCYTMVSHPELICGQIESAGHVHSEACYTTFENTYLACGMEESAGHVHDASCYTTVVAEDGTETTELTCAIPESIGHVHTDACYVTETVTELTCAIPESAGHTHTEACWANVESMELTCGKEESAGHTHTEACFAEQKFQICDQPEVIPHVHGDECYTVVGYAEDGSEIKELTCPMTVVESHEHTADCFTSYEMTVEVPHQHTDLCYVQVLTCTLPEHEHTDECYVAPAEPEVSAEPEIEYLCGMAEHAHDATCYTTYIAEDGTETTELTCQLPEHIHDETCQPAEIVEGDVEIVEDETPHFQLPVLVCGLAEHEHSTNCMDENMNYVCGLAQHSHTGECYDIPGMDGVTPILTCALHEHFHTEACYNENGELACGLEEHTHTVGCFTLPEGVEEPEVIEEPALPTWCGMEEHTHDETCYDGTGALICGIEEHIHSDLCFIEPTWYCGFTAHTHSESCLNEAGELVCGMIEHTHDENCLIPPVYYCGLEEHTHSEACYDESGALICGKSEHTHDASCLVQRFVQVAGADNVLVTAEYTSEAGLPEEAQLQVARFDAEADAEHYEARMSEAGEVFAAANPDQTFQPVALLKIGFYLADGTEVEPAAPVAVKVQLLDANGEAEGQPLTVIHYGENGAELVDASGETGTEEATVAFSADAFSDFMVLRDTDPSDEGSEPTVQPTVPPIIMGAPFSANYLMGYGMDTPEFMTIAGSYDSGADITFENNKYIDYLGDNQTGEANTDNPDTTVDEKTAVTDDLYRLYLDMSGKTEPIDLVIVLDRSDSMAADITNTTNSDINKQKWKLVYDALEGTEAKGYTDGLIYQFLQANYNADGTLKDPDDRNNVAVVWFGADPTITPLIRTEGVGPNAGTEGGVTREWFSEWSHAGTDGYIASEDASYTNYVAGLYQAHVMLQQKDDDGHKKVIIFMSDGVPVYYYYSSDMVNWDNPTDITRYGRGAESCVFYDTATEADNRIVRNYINNTLKKITNNNRLQAGYQGVLKEKINLIAEDNNDAQTTGFYYSPYMNETRRIFSGTSGVSMPEGTPSGTSFLSLHPGIDFYSIFVGNAGKIQGAPNDTKDEKGQAASTYQRDRLLQDMAADAGGKEFTVDETSSIESALEQIMLPYNVVISDTLSAYVDLYTPQPDIKVTARDNQSKAESTLWSYTGQPLTGSGVITITPTSTGALDGTPASEIIQSVTYDTSTKTIQLKFNPDYKLGHYTYTLSFNVQLTAEAYETYAQSGYSVSGDANTDYTLNGNNTSSVKPGLFSNSSATVTYTVDGEDKTEDYPDPVVQPWRTQLKLYKIDQDGHKIPGVQFKLTWNGTPVMPIGTGNTAGSDGFYITDGDGYITYGYLLAGNYTLTEIVPVGYEGAGSEKVVASFVVQKGRITSAKPEKGIDPNVTWSDGASVNPYEVNSIPNTDYGTDVSITIKNELIKKHVKMVKQDAAGNALGGVAFTLQRTVNGATTDWTDGLKVSDASGLFFDGTLLYGNYALKEATHPAGYEDLPGEVTFEVTTGGSIEIKDNPQITVDNTQRGAAVVTEKGDELTITITNTPIEYAWDVLKVDGSVGTKHLAGAEFSLYGPYEPGASFDPSTAGDPTWTFVTGETGHPADTAGMPNLQPGKEYYLVETAAPDGYSMLNGNIKLMITATDPAEPVMSATLNGTNLDVSVDHTSGKPVCVITVKNNVAGYVLPESGGIGTTVFYVGGLTLIAMAGAVFCARKRREAQG